MVRIDAFGMPSEELIARIEAEAGVGNREIVVTTDSKDTLEDLVAYSNESDSSIDINVVENDKGALGDRWRGSSHAAPFKRVFCS